MAKPRHRLKALRESRDLTQEALAHDVGVAVTTYRDWEQGRRSPLPGFRRRLAKHLGVTLHEVVELLDESTVLNGHRVPEWLGHLASLEQAASRLWRFESVVVPGLLQTRDYATAVERVGPDVPTEDHIARLVETRIARQRVLDRRHQPLALYAVLDESVLYRVAGSRSIMATQLDHLADMATAPNISVRVLSLRSGVFSAAFGAFSVLTSADATEPYMACVDDRAGPHYLDRSYEVQVHAALFKYLSEVALPPDESIDLVRTVAKEYQS